MERAIGLARFVPGPACTGTIQGVVQLAVHQGPAEADGGAAAPVAVLVHGIGGWWQTWWRVAPALANRGWRVVAVDLRGHGASPRIEGTVTREELAFDLVETIEALEAGPIDVAIGHSLGAAAVQELAHGWPELVGRVVLEDPPGQDRTDDVAYQGRLAAEVRAATETPEAEVERGLRDNPSWLSRTSRASGCATSTAFWPRCLRGWARACRSWRRS